MNYTEFKSYVRMFRPVYDGLTPYVCTLLRNTLQCYARYMSMSRSGVSEDRVIQQYGIFLWHYAELENLTVEQITEYKEVDKYEWTMTHDALGIIRDFEEHNSDDNEILKRVSNWCRHWFSYISANRHFYDAMTAFRVMQTKN